MAGHDHFLTRLRAVLRTLDDEALAALANKGLLRRARKDLESQRPTLLSVDASVARVKLSDAMVEVPESPARSRCDCPASGVCRHVLAALVFLRDDPEVERLAADSVGGEAPSDSDDGDAPSAAPQASAPSPDEILGKATDEDLRRWAGRATFKKALAWLAGNPDVEIESQGALVVRFPTRNITCRWIPADGLLGLVCSCQAETACEHVVATVLAFQTRLGVRSRTIEAPALEESSGAPRTRGEVLASVLALVGELTSLGLSRLSMAVERRLTTLAVSAHGVDLPRLERSLATLARATSLVVRRDAQSSTADVLLQSARVVALATALRDRPLPHLVGQHRAKYQSVGQLTFVGVGAEWWRSKGGQHGVTVYFWNEASRGWATWSDSRPVAAPGFDPVRRFHGEGPWLGCESPREASGSVVRLTGAYMSDGGRLSARAGTLAYMLGATPTGRWRDTIPAAVSRWSDLVPRIRRQFGGGLTLPPENGELVALLPTAWGPSEYDATRQQWRRLVVDEAGRVLPLWLPFTPEHAASIDYLERRQFVGTCGVFGALRIVGGQVVVQPISLLTDERIVSLNLDDDVLGKKGAASIGLAPRPTAAATPAAARSPGQSPSPADDPVAGEEESAVGDDCEAPARIAGTTSSGLSRAVISAMAELEAIAESGVLAGGRDERLAELAARLASLGLSACAAALRDVYERLERRAQLAEASAQQAAAYALLRAYYVLGLAVDQELLTALTASYV